MEEAADQLALLLPELRHLMLEYLPLQTLTQLTVTNKRWRAFVAAYVTELLHGEQLDLLGKLTPNGQLRLSALFQRRAIVVTGGYNTAWNAHAACAMAEDGPGCEQSAEALCLLGPPWNEAVPKWLKMPPMQQRRADLALVSPSPSIILALGGREGTVAHRSVERLSMPDWQLRQQGWSMQEIPPMLTPRSGLVAACIQGRVLAAGGTHLLAAGGNGYRTAEMLTINSHHEHYWEPLPSLRLPRSYACSTVLHDAWYVIGGDRHLTRRAVEVLTPSRHSGWIDLPECHIPRHSASAVTYRGSVLVVGGGHRAPIEAFDPREGFWRMASWHARSHHGHNVGTTAVVDQDTLFVAGGMNPIGSNRSGEPPGHSSSTVRIFDLRYLGHQPECFQMHQAFEQHAGAPIEQWTVPPPGGLPIPTYIREGMQVKRWCSGACVVSMAA